MGNSLDIAIAGAAISCALIGTDRIDTALETCVRDRLVATVARIPPETNILTSMMAGTVLNPFKPIGLAEARWLNRFGG